MCGGWFYIRIKYYYILRSIVIDCIILVYMPYSLEVVLAVLRDHALDVTQQVHFVLDLLGTLFSLVLGFFPGQELLLEVLLQGRGVLVVLAGLLRELEERIPGGGPAACLSLRVS